MRKVERAIKYPRRRLFKGEWIEFGPYRVYQASFFEIGLKRVTHPFRLIRNFEPQSRWDYALVPWWLLRYAFAWLWSQFWYPLRNFNFWYWRVRYGRPLRWLPRDAGRHIDPDPIMCRRCLWAGPRRWAWHTYEDDGDGDVSPVDQCPRCGEEV